MKFNKIRLLGHLGKDPISFKSKNDLLIVRFSIATNEGYGSHKKKKTLWHEIVAFGKTAELALKLLKKGSIILPTLFSHQLLIFYHIFNSYLYTCNP